MPPEIRTEAEGDDGARASQHRWHNNHWRNNHWHNYWHNHY